MTAGEDREETRVARTAGIISAGIVLSRIMGMVREVVVTRAFGATQAAEAFFVAFRIPNLGRELLAEGALSAAVVPVFSQYMARRSRADAIDLVHAVLTVLLILLSAATLIGIGAAPWIVRTVAPGFGHGDKFDLAVTLARAMFPFLVFVGLAALATGILNALRRFTVPALASVALNLGIIAGALFLPPYVDPPILGLAIGELVGGFLQILVQVPFLLKEKILVRLRWDPRNDGLWRIGRLFLPAAVGAGAVQINAIVGTVLASYLAEGSVSYLFYGMRLVQLPLGVFGAAVATAILPALSFQAANGENVRFRETFSSGMSVLLLVTVPAGVGLVFFAEPVVSTVFMRGAFDASAAAGTSRAVAAYAAGLWAYAAVRAAADGFFSMQDARVPMAGAVVAVAVNALLSLLLMGPLSHAGLALATAVASAVNAVFLLYFLRRRLGAIGGRRIGRTFLFALVGSIPIAAIGIWISSNDFWLTEGRLGGKIAWLAIGIGASLIAYGAILRIVAPGEWAWVRDVFRRRGRDLPASRPV